MPSIIDAFVVEFSLDPAKFTAGQKAVVETIRKTEDSATHFAKEMEEKGAKAAEFFKQLRTQVIGLYAAFTAGRGLKEFVSDITHADSALGYMARRLNMGTGELAKWQNTMKALGGSADDADSSFSAMTQDFENLMITGESQFLPFYRALGVRVADANGALRSQSAIMDDLNRAFSDIAKRDPARAFALGAQMGFTPKMMDLLTKAPDEYHKILAEQEKLGHATEADAKAAQARQIAWNNFITTATNLGRQILTTLTPSLISFIHVLAVISNWFNAHPIIIKAAFAAITAVVTVLTVAISEKLAGAALGKLLTRFREVRTAGIAAFNPTGSTIGQLTKGAFSLAAIIGLLSTDSVPGLGNSLVELGIAGPAVFSLVSSSAGLLKKVLVEGSFLIARMAQTALPALASAFLEVGYAIDATPLGWIVTALAAVGIAAYELYKNWDWVWRHMAEAVRTFIPLYNHLIAPILGLPKVVEQEQQEQTTPVVPESQLPKAPKEGQAQTLHPGAATAPTSELAPQPTPRIAPTATGSVSLSTGGATSFTKPVDNSLAPNIAASSTSGKTTLGNAASFLGGVAEALNPITPAHAEEVPVHHRTPPPSSVPVPKAKPTTGYAPSVGSKAATSAAKNARESDIQALMGMGWTREQAIGIEANIVRESSGNATATGDRGLAYGLAQWHPDRQAAFAKFAGHDIRQSNREEQLAFINYELREGSMKRAGEALKRTTSAPEAAQAVSNKYEIPANAQGEAATRAQIAAAIAGLPASLLATAGAGTRAGATYDNRVTTYHSDTRVGQVVVNTQATDAQGIAREIKPILQRQSFAAATDSGPS